MGWYYHPPECMCVCAVPTRKGKNGIRVLGGIGGEMGIKKEGWVASTKKGTRPNQYILCPPTHTHTRRHTQPVTHIIREKKTGWLE